MVGDESTHLVAHLEGVLFEDRNTPKIVVTRDQYVRYHDLYTARG